MLAVVLINLFYQVNLCFLKWQTEESLMATFKFLHFSIILWCQRAFFKVELALLLNARVETINFGGADCLRFPVH